MLKIFRRLFQLLDDLAAIRKAVEYLAAAERHERERNYRRSDF